MSQNPLRLPGKYRQGGLLRAYAKQGIIALAVTAALALLTSCGSSSGSGSSGGTGTTTPTSALKITTSTTIFPTFDPTITDYVATAPSGALQVSVNAPPGTQVSVDGQTAHTNAFSASVKVAAGQSFPIVVNTAGTSSTYYVRCLPSDFPAWTTERPGTPQTEYYAFTPDTPLTTGDAKHYLILADSHGVPVWWYRSSLEPRNPLLLADGNIAFTVGTGYVGSAVEEHKFDGTLVHSFNVDTSNAGTLDLHELLQLSNGDFIVIADVFQGPVDFTAEGGSSSAAVVDNEIEEISPSGSLVWHWSALAHIPVSETDPAWWPQYIQAATLPDPYHMNSVAVDGSGLIVSFRHMDAVYRIDKATGNIVWKLGGTHRAESLAFNGDTYGNFSGQHDARLLSDGTLTVHDNGTSLSRPPRAVRYSIDTTAKTATLVEHVTDPDVSSSLCCGSVRKGMGGNWVMDWGDNPAITELTPAGARVFRMTFKDPYFSYRALPVPAGVLTRPALRSGMDTQYPRTTSQ